MYAIMYHILINSFSNQYTCVPNYIVICAVDKFSKTRFLLSRRVVNYILRKEKWHFLPSNTNSYHITCAEKCPLFRPKMT